MASLLKSEAAFRERAAECGLNQAEIDRLVDNGVSSLATLAYSLTVPGTPPTEQSLRSLLNEPDPASVPLRALAEMRRLMFESQTLAMSQIRASIEHDGEKRVELAPAERASRIEDQRQRLKGYDLSGPLENAFSNYTYVNKMLEDDHPSYLEPHRFVCRSSEVARERPGKELVIDESSRMLIKDKQYKDKCQIQSDLQLSEALTRRSLACDLLQVCSFHVMEKWHRFLLNQMAVQPPPNFKKTTMEQVLRCDRAAWVRLAELVPTLKRDAGGELPLDKAFPGLVHDAQVMFHLLPLRSSVKRTHDGSAKTEEQKGKGKGKKPKELLDPRLKHNCSRTGKRRCWNSNLKIGCKFAKPGGECKRGVHTCMFCEGDHSLHECPTYKPE